MECKTVGPSSRCFCGHFFKFHNTDDEEKKIPCREQGCRCRRYSYIPIQGSADIKCTCRHSYTDHNPMNRKCVSRGCQCQKFYTS
mmetsp:Transcript_4436/g.593  ORF Transcript_4436/g.593 Transcript_4436/m.593 type:complete len:85 (+) Transcript_4436:179-433(+)